MRAAMKYCHCDICTEPDAPEPEEETVKMVEVDKDKLQDLEENIQNAEGNLLGLQEDVKAAKKELDKALEALRTYVRETVNPTKLPLLDEGGTVNTKTGEIRQ
jgi:molecular chaperone GrpE (heat shock protein)